MVNYRGKKTGTVIVLALCLYVLAYNYNYITIYGSTLEFDGIVENDTTNNSQSQPLPIAIPIQVGVAYNMSTSQYLEYLNKIRTAKFAQYKYTNNTINHYNYNGIICHKFAIWSEYRSGTTTLEKLVKIIYQYFCALIRRQNISLSFCKQPLSAVAVAGKHHLDRKEALVNASNFNFNYTATPNGHRDCTFTAFRDPRDRFLSGAILWSKGNALKRNLTFSDEYFKDYEWSKFYFDPMKGFKSALIRSNEWWEKLVYETVNDPMYHFIYFFSDFVLFPDRIIKQMIDFIGFYQIKQLLVGDDAIANIIDLIGDGFHRTLRQNRTQFCDFGNYLGMENARNLTKNMNKYLLPQLKDEYNRTCSVPL